MIISGQRGGLGGQNLAQKDTRFHTRIFEPLKKVFCETLINASDIKKPWCYCSVKSPLYPTLRSCCLQLFNTLVIGGTLLGNWQGGCGVRGVTLVWAKSSAFSF